MNLADLFDLRLVGAGEVAEDGEEGFMLARGEGISGEGAEVIAVGNGG